jgi:hypothetical protein
MLAFLKQGADFSRGCAYPATRPPISATHPHRFANRAPLATITTRANGANGVSSARFARLAIIPRSGQKAARVNGGKRKGRGYPPNRGVAQVCPGATEAGYTLESYEGRATDQWGGGSFREGNAGEAEGMR